MIKRFFAFFLAMCLIFSMTPANVFAVTGDEDIAAGEQVSQVKEEPTGEPTEAPAEVSPEKTVMEDFEEISAQTNDEDPTVPGEGCTAHEDGMHVYTAKVTKPTCTEGGKTTYTCPCGERYVADYVDALGHDAKDGRCTVCGAAVLAAPVITASNIESSGKILVTWERVAGAAKYRVYRADAKNGEYTRILTTTGTTCKHLKAVAGESYYYKVEAIAEDGTVSGFSNIVKRTCDLPRPSITVSNVEKTGKIRVTWESVEGAVRYQVYRGESKDGPFKRILTTSGTSCIHTGAAAGQTYYYKVRAIAQVSAANSAYSAVKARACDLAQPKLTVSNVEKTGKIRLSWEVVEGAEKYKIYICNADGALLKTTTTTQTSVVHSSAEAGAAYTYKVRALCGVSAATSAYSAAKVRTCDLARPRLTVSNVEKTGKIRLSWDAVEGAEKYKVYIYNADGALLKTNTTAKTFVTHGSAEAGVAYTYKVRALCSVSAATSAYSASKTRTCDLAQPKLTVSNVAQTGKIQVCWEAVDGAVEYRLYCADQKDGEYQCVLKTTDTSWVHEDAQVGQKYYYKVRAIAEKSAANSVYSAINSRSCVYPAPVVTGTADFETGKPRLTWELVDGAVSYKVYRSETPDGSYKLMYTSSSNTYMNTKCEVGKTYYYKVKAVGENGAAASAASDMVAVTAVSNVYQYVYASYTTTKSGSAERNTNLALSCKAINGTILKPGDTFSFNEVVGPRTRSKGYQSAPIVGGMGVGGGICQVSTTLFNVALFGNLDITQRRQHSVAVTYVPMGRDAMIYKTASDLKFVNNSDYCIKILASASGGTVTMSMVTREPDVSPASDVELVVNYDSGVYTLERYYQGDMNYTCRSKY